MNENSILANDPHPTDSVGGDSMPHDTAEELRETSEMDGDRSDAALGAEEAVGLPASSCEDPDPDLASSSEEAAEGGLEQLRAELRELKQALGARDAFLTRLGEECEEFASLFPETPLSSLPDDVWKDVNRGIPLAAAYALTERRRVLREALAKESNHANKQRSVGAVTGEEEGFFSPSEVREMSQDEVRTNYATILKSMKRWNFS